MADRLLYEVKWFAAGFVVPLGIVLVLEMAFIASTLPLWRRVLTLEDTCAYGLCFLIAAVVYLVALGLRRRRAG